MKHSFPKGQAVWFLRKYPELNVQEAVVRDTLHGTSPDEASHYILDARISLPYKDGDTRIERYDVRRGWVFAAREEADEALQTIRDGWRKETMAKTATPVAFVETLLGYLRTDDLTSVELEIIRARAEEYFGISEDTL